MSIAEALEEVMKYAQGLPKLIQAILVAWKGDCRCRACAMIREELEEHVRKRKVG